MKVGWLHDNPGYVGGAELTMAEYKAAAPDGVEVIDCPTGDVLQGLDRYVVGNCLSYPRFPDGPIIRYHHDVTQVPGDKDPDIRHIFCSPLQQKRMKLDGECIPPALDLASFEAVANQNHRKGAVCVGRMAYGKGLELLAEYEEPVDIYSSVPCQSRGNARYLGPASDVAETLSKYETFVFLPQAIEPFGRAVVEAWASGCVLVLNKNIGALHYIVNDQPALRTAAEDFWNLVTE